MTLRIPDRDLVTSLDAMAKGMRISRNELVCHLIQGAVMHWDSDGRADFAQATFKLMDALSPFVREATKK